MNLTRYESFLLFTFYFLLSACAGVPAGRRAGRDFQQAGFGQRDSAHESAARADQAGASGVAECATRP